MKIRDKRVDSSRNKWIPLESLLFCILINGVTDQAYNCLQYIRTRTINKMHLNVVPIPIKIIDRKDYATLLIMAKILVLVQTGRGAKHAGICYFNETKNSLNRYCA